MKLQNFGYHAIIFISCPPVVILMFKVIRNISFNEHLEEVNTKVLKSLKLIREKNEKKKFLTFNMQAEELLKLATLKCVWCV